MARGYRGKTGVLTLRASCRGRLGCRRRSEPWGGNGVDLHGSTRVIIANEYEATMNLEHPRYVPQSAGSRAGGLTTAFKLIDAAQARCTRSTSRISSFPSVPLVRAASLPHDGPAVTAESTAA